MARVGDDTLRVRWEEGRPVQLHEDYQPVQQPFVHFEKSKREPERPNKCPLIQEDITAQLFWGVLATHVILTLLSTLWTSSGGLLWAGGGGSHHAAAGSHAVAEWHPSHPGHGKGFAASSLDLREVGCLHPQGGGELTSGNDFLLPRPAPRQCGPTVAKYLAAQYDQDVAAVAAEARQRVVRECSSGSRKLVVLNIDDTSLSLIKALNASGGANKLTSMTPKDLAGVLRQKQEAGKLPPLRPVLELYRSLQDCGIATAFVTARPEHLRAVTEANLAAAGYGRLCKPDAAAAGNQTAAPPPKRRLMSVLFRMSWQERRQQRKAAKAATCYQQLAMRAKDIEGVPAAVHKHVSSTRLQEEGWRVAAVIGDQLSDLTGALPPALAFKLPNPLYYVP